MCCIVFSHCKLGITLFTRDVPKNPHLRVLCCAVLPGLLSRWYMASVIIGATSVEQAKENIDACLLKLDDETLEAMDQLYTKHGNITFTD